VVDDNLKLRAAANTDRMWIEIREYYEEIIDFLSDGIEGKNISYIIDLSLKLVVAELILNEEKYASYNLKEYSIDEFIKKAIIEPIKDTPDYEDRKNSEKFIEEVRSEMWGYIKRYYNDLIDIFFAIEYKEFPLTEEQENRLIECVCVVYIESNFRQKEIYFLERDLK
jgi:hypothetical protein